MENKVLEKVDIDKEKFLSLARYIFENPELALEEHLAVKKLIKVMEIEGFEIEDKLGGMATAFRAKKANGNGPRIAFIAEYDALPGIGHACGHHLISAMSMGAALALSEVLTDLPGEISLIGTPAEENGNGKTYLIDSGIFNDTDVALMIHPNNKTFLAPEMLMLAGLEITFLGRAAHAAASPEEGINALDAVILLFSSINALRQQLKDDVRIHGIIVEGGEAPNSIPAKCKARIEIRTKEPDYFEEVIKKVKNCAFAAGLATGAEVEINNFEPTILSMKTNHTLSNIFKEQLEKFNLDYLEDAFPIGSSDIGNLSWVIPCIHPFFKVTEGMESLHTDGFLKASLEPFALERTVTGAKLLALTGLKLLQNPDLVEEAKAE